MFVSNLIFDFDLFDLMRYVYGKQLMLGGQLLNQTVHRLAS